MASSRCWGALHGCLTKCIDGEWIDPGINGAIRNLRVSAWGQLRGAQTSGNLKKPPARSATAP